MPHDLKSLFLLIQVAYLTENVEGKTDDCLLNARGEKQTLSLCPDDEGRVHV